MPRHERNTRVAWAAGTAGTPSAEAPYQVLDLDFGPNERVNIGANENYMGFLELGNGDVLDRMTSVSFGLEMKEQTATNVPWIGGALLRACGFNESKAGGSYEGYIYTLSSSLDYYSTGDLDAIDLRVNRGFTGGSLYGAQELLKDCVGSVVFTLRAGERPRADFSFIGRINSSVATRSIASMTDTTFATSFTSEARPYVVSDCSATIAGVSCPIREIICDVGNSTVDRPSINGDIGSYEVPDISGRQTSYSVLIEHQLLATLNLHDKVIDRTTIALTGKIAQGAGSGKEIQFDFTGRATGQGAFERDRGIVYYRIPLQQAIANSSSSYTNPLKFTWKSAA